MTTCHSTLSPLLDLSCALYKGHTLRHVACACVFSLSFSTTWRSLSRHVSLSLTTRLSLDACLSLSPLGCSRLLSLLSPLISPQPPSLASRLVEPSRRLRPRLPPHASRLIPAICPPRGRRLTLPQLSPSLSDRRVPRRIHLFFSTRRRLPVGSRLAEPADLGCQLPRRLLRTGTLLASTRVLTLRPLAATLAIANSAGYHTDLLVSASCVTPLSPLASLLVDETLALRRAPPSSSTASSSTQVQTRPPSPVLLGYPSHTDSPAARGPPDRVQVPIPASMRFVSVLAGPTWDLLHVGHQELCLPQYPLSLPPLCRLEARFFHLSVWGQMKPSSLLMIQRS